MLAPTRINQGACTLFTAVSPVLINGYYTVTSHRSPLTAVDCRDYQSQSSSSLTIFCSRVVLRPVNSSVTSSGFLNRSVAT